MGKHFSYDRKNLFRPEVARPERVGLLNFFACLTFCVQVLYFDLHHTISQIFCPKLRVCPTLRGDRKIP